jgi:hypothetical protein
MHLTAVLPRMQWQVVPAKRKRHRGKTGAPSPATPEGKKPMRNRFALPHDDDDDVCGSTWVPSIVLW